jgi:hypothetical protein
VEIVRTLILGYVEIFEKTNVTISVNMDLDILLRRLVEGGDGASSPPTCATMNMIRIFQCSQVYFSEIALVISFFFSLLFLWLSVTRTPLA